MRIVIEFDAADGRATVTTEPQPVSVGGLDGVYLDISIDPAWTTA